MRELVADLIDCGAGVLRLVPIFVVFGSPASVTLAVGLFPCGAFSLEVVWGVDDAPPKGVLVVSASGEPVSPLAAKVVSGTGGLARSVLALRHGARTHCDAIALSTSLPSCVAGVSPRI